MSLFKRNGKWYYYFIVDNVRYRKSCGHATRKQAERMEAEAKFAAIEGRYERSGQMPLSEFIEKHYLPWARVNKRSWKSDEFHTNVILDFFGRTRQLGDIAAGDVERFKQSRIRTPGRVGSESEGPRASSTVNREIACLSKIFSLAIEYGEAEINPCVRVKKLKENNKRRRFLSEDEEARLLAQCVGDRAHLARIIKFALNTGLRRGELFNLKWSDVAPTFIHIRESKSGKERFIPLNDAAKEVLGIYSLNLNEYVFPSPRTGERLTTIKTAFRQACFLAKIGDVRFHDLRHTFASRLIDKGVDPVKVKELLGHADLRMTERYTHASDEGKMEAVNRL